MVAHACKPSHQESEAKGFLHVPEQPRLLSEFKAGMNYIGYRKVTVSNSSSRILEFPGTS